MCFCFFSLSLSLFLSLSPSDFASGTGNLVGSDLEIDVIDIIKIVDLILAEPAESGSCEFLTADVNGDEQINVSVESGAVGKKRVRAAHLRALFLSCFFFFLCCCCCCC